MFEQKLCRAIVIVEELAVAEIRRAVASVGPASRTFTEADAEALALEELAVAVAVAPADVVVLRRLLVACEAPVGPRAASWQGERLSIGCPPNDPDAEALSAGRLVSVLEDVTRESEVDAVILVTTSTAPVWVLERLRPRSVPVVVVACDALSAAHTTGRLSERLINCATRTVLVDAWLRDRARRRHPILLDLLASRPPAEPSPRAAGVGRVIDGVITRVGPQYGFIASPDVGTSVYFRRNLLAADVPVQVQMPVRAVIEERDGKVWARSLEVLPGSVRDAA